MNKRIPEFWKSWSSKFHQNVTNDVYINSSNNERVVSNAFADHFSSIYSISFNDLDAKRDFDVLCADDIFSKADLISIVNVESVDRCIRKLKWGKACGPDGLSCEHLVNAHPLLVIHLCALFRGLICMLFASCFRFWYYRPFNERQNW